MIDTRILFKQSIPYAITSLFSSLSLFLLLAQTIGLISANINSQTRLVFLPLIVLGLILAAEVYIFSLAARLQRQSAGAKFREVIFVVLFLYIFGLLTFFLRDQRLIFIPNANFIFLMLWGLFFWVSFENLYSRFLSRIDISNLLESQRGEMLNRILQDEMPFVAGSYKMMKSAETAAKLRVLACCIVIVVYVIEVQNMQVGFVILAAISLLSQFSVSATARMYAEDHSYLAWGAIPDGDQRKQRGSIVQGLILASGLLAIPFTRARSIINPEVLLSFLSNMFKTADFRKAAARVESIRQNFSNQNEYINWQDYNQMDTGTQLTFLFDVLNNLIYISLAVLFLYFVLLPIIQNPAIISDLIKAIRSRNAKILWAELKKSLRLWFSAFLENIRSTLLFPFKALSMAFRSIFKLPQRGKKNRSPAGQKIIAEQIINRETGNTQRSAEHQNEIKTLGHIFATLVSNFTELGLHIKKSSTIREVRFSCERLYSEAEKIGDTTTGDSVRKGLNCICGGLEKSLYSAEPVGNAVIEQAKEALESIQAAIKPED